MDESSQEARALTQRMPPTMIKTDPVIQNSISVLRSIWQNKYSETYAILRNQPWPDPVSIIVKRFDGECIFRIRSSKKLLLLPSRTKD
jgi:COP9 signalosome complex subunit 8